jgi:hypothetical protein
VSFDVLYRSTGNNEATVLCQIGHQEAVWINQERPVLNYQIPGLDDYTHYTVNKKAKTITLEEILYPNEVFIFE